MTSNQIGQEQIEFTDNTLYAAICGPLDKHLALIEQNIDVSISRLGNTLLIQGDMQDVSRAKSLFHGLISRAKLGKSLTEDDVYAALRFQSNPVHTQLKDTPPESEENSGPMLLTPRKKIYPRSPNQSHMIRALQSEPLVFGFGPAGTGKTYLAVAAAVEALSQGRVERIILSRPAVEAGERLGFLPGDMKEKVDPYMQPLYDALHDCLMEKQLTRMFEDKTIEIAPLGFMRGRTLSRAFIVLDEAQNATRAQMKMFLTRLGRDSTMAVTGDPSQIDLPEYGLSGLLDAVKRLENFSEVAVCAFTEKDVVRHPLVSKIIRAYAQ